jgi:hypothetical protein
VNYVLTVTCSYCNVWQSCSNSTYSSISINVSNSKSSSISSSSSSSYRSRERIIIITMTLSVIKMSLLPYQVGRLLQSLSHFWRMSSFQ